MSFPKILFSGYVDIEKSNDFKNKINSLKGEYLNSNTQYDLNATHIICFKFSSTEKIICGLVSGIWLLNEKYIEDSYNAGHWLAENPYELSDFNHLAKYHRMRYKKAFQGKTIYVNAEKLETLHSLQRILTVGGANVVRDENQNIPTPIDFALCDKSTLDRVKSLIPKGVPILNMDYIKNVVFYRHKPEDMGKFSFSPLSDSNPMDSEIEVERVVIRPCPIKSKTRNRFRPNMLQKSIDSYVLKPTIKLENEETNSPDDDDIKIVEEVYKHPDSLRAYNAGCFSSNYNDSDYIEIIEDLKKQPINEEKNCLEEQNIDKNNLSIISVSSDTPNIKEEKQFIVNKTTQIIKQEQPDTVLKSVSVVKETTKIVGQEQPNTVLKSVSMNLSSDEDLLSSNKEKLSKYPQPVSTNLSSDKHLLSTNMEKLNKYLQPVSTNLSSDKHLLSTNMEKLNKYSQPVSTNLSSDKHLLSTNMEKLNKYPQPVSTNLSSDKHLLSTNMEKLSKYSQPVSMDLSSDKDLLSTNMEELSKYPQPTVLLDLHFERKVVQDFIANLNSSFYLLCHVDDIPIVPMTVKKAKELSERDTLEYQSRSYKTMTVKEGRYKKDVLVPDRKPKDELLSLTCLDFLHLFIDENSYPHATVMANLLKYDILEASSEYVSCKAVRIFARMVQIHPPKSKGLRDYYLRIFDSVIDSQNETCNKKWLFLKTVIDRAVGLAEDKKSDHLLDSIVTIFYEDLKYYKEQPVSVKSLFSYRFFWENKRQRPSLDNATVKEFTALWLKGTTYPIFIRQSITNLFTVLMEVVWKYNDCYKPNIFSSWPLNQKWMAIIGEIYIQFNRFGDHHLLFQMIQECLVPWQRMLYTCLLVRILEPTFENSNFSISTMKKLLEQEAEKCKKKSAEFCKEEHKFKLLLISQLLNDHLEAIGSKYYQERLLSMFNSMMNDQKITVHSHSTQKNQLLSKDGTTKDDSSAKESSDKAIPNKRKREHKESDSESFNSSMATTDSLLRLIRKEYRTQRSLLVEIEDKPKCRHLTSVVLRHSRIII